MSNQPEDTAQISTNIDGWPCANRNRSNYHQEILNEAARIDMKIEPDGNAFHAYAPALKGCHVGGATKEEAKHNLNDAIYLYIECFLERGEPIPIGE